MQGDARDGPDALQSPGVVELREDVPLKAGGGGGWGAGGGGGGGGACAGGPRLILAAFAALSAAITLALLTQIYYGDYEVSGHGSVSSSAAACSRAGVAALGAGAAADAAAAAALCLAVLAPHRISLDASGSLLYWEYRQSLTQQPLIFEWGGPESVSTLAPAITPSAPLEAASSSETTGEVTSLAQMSLGPASLVADNTRPPRLVVALAAFHARYGVLPWATVLQPAIDLARNGFNVSEGLAEAEGSIAGTPRRSPRLADYLETLQANTSAQVSSAWGVGGRWRAGAWVRAGAWRATAAGAGAAGALRALAAALLPPTAAAAATAADRVISSLQEEAAQGDWPPGGVSSGLAVVDRVDTYVAMAAGLSKPFGTGPASPHGWMYDEPTAPIDVAPAIMTDNDICGTRYVMGAESSGALAQAAAALALGGDAAAAVGAGVERARALVLRGGTLAPERAPAAPGTPAPAVNVVRQRADALLSYADSRGGGYAARF